MKPKTVNLPASVRARLLAVSRAQGVEFQSVLVRYGLERLLYRLSLSRFAVRFVLKGALLFEVWTADRLRSTQDADFLHLGSASPEELKSLFRSVCGEPVEDDGLTFLPDTVVAEDIREDQAYGGVRVTLTAQLGKAVIPLQVDVGLGDIVTPEPEQADFPSLLGQPSPHLAIYTRETVVAEKFEAMVVLDLPNSRMKDFFDIWVLSQRFHFAGEDLQKAVEATFRRRRTPLTDTLPTALTERFSGDALKRAQWQAFASRGRFSVQPPPLEDVVKRVAAFLGPIMKACSRGEILARQWKPEGPWRRPPQV